MSYGHDFEEIEAAVMETARGRWFLAEFANRNRVAETRVLLEAIARLERSLGDGPTRRPAGEPADALARIRGAIAEARTALAGVGAEEGRTGEIRLGEVLHGLLEKTRVATSEILDVAETVQETSWTLRERGADPNSCDALDRGATAIHTATSFHDLAAERLGKVLAALRIVETLIDGPAEVPAAAAPRARSLRRLETEAAADDIAFVVRDATVLDRPPPTPPSRPDAGADAAPTPAAAGSRADDPTPTSPAGAAGRHAVPPLAALAEIDKLDVRERIRLFT